MVHALAVCNIRGAHGWPPKVTGPRSDIAAWQIWSRTGESSGNGSHKLLRVELVKMNYHLLYLLVFPPLL